MGRGGAGTGLGAGLGEIPAAGRGYDGFGLRGCDGFGLRGCDGGGGPEPALAGRRAVEARTGAGGRLGSCPRRNDGKSAGRCSGTFSWGAVWARGCIWSGRFGVVRFGQVWSAAAGWERGLVLGAARYPRRGAGMTDLGCAGVTDLGCAGVTEEVGRNPLWPAVEQSRRAPALEVAWVPARAGMTGRAPGAVRGPFPGGRFGLGVVSGRGGSAWSGLVRFGQPRRGGNGVWCWGGEIPAAGRGYDGST